MKKQYILALMTLLLTMTLIGCGKKSVKESISDTTPIITQEPQDQVTATTIPEKEDEPALIPFSTSPEDDIQIAYMDDIINNVVEYTYMYCECLPFIADKGEMPEDLEAFIDKIQAEKGEDEAIRFMINTAKYAVVKAKTVLQDMERTDLEEVAIKLIQDYLKYSRLGDSESNTFYFTKEMEEADPIEKVKTYMSENDIIVTDIVFSDSVESSTFYFLQPMRFTYRYTIKGTIKGQAFEKEVVQDFYIGVDNNIIEENILDAMVIEYIKDTPE